MPKFYFGLANGSGLANDDPASTSQHSGEILYYDSAPVVSDNVRSTATTPSATGTNFVANMPAGPVNGDVIEIAIGFAGGSTIASVTPPAGWTSVKRQNNTTISGTEVFRHQVTNAGGEPSTYTWTLSASVAAIAIAAMFFNIDQANIEDVAASGNNGTGTTLTGTGITLATANAILAWWAHVAAVSTTITVPSSPDAFNAQQADATGAMRVGTNTHAATGATGNEVGSSSTSPAGWDVILSALRPSVAASLTAVPNVGGTAVAVSSSQRVNFAATGTHWSIIALALTLDATTLANGGSLGAITVDSDTTAHATLTAPTVAGTITFTDAIDRGITATLAADAVATTPTFSGPTGGAQLVASTNFTVALPAAQVVGSDTVVSLSDGGAGGTFTPTSVTFVANTPADSHTFTYTPPVGVATRVLTPTGSGLTFSPTTKNYAVTGGSLSTAAPATGTAVGVSVTGERINFVGTGTAWNSGTPTFTVSAGSLGAVTVDSDTTAHANFSAPATPQMITVTDTLDGSTTATFPVDAVATTCTFSGPSSGAISVASTNFTVQLPASQVVTGNVVVTPSDGGAGGTFTPSTVTFTKNVPNQSKTFTYTPATIGVITLTPASSLTASPTTLSYTSSAVPGTLSDTHVVNGLSKWNWDDFTTYKRATSPGAYSWLQWTGTEIAVGVRVTELAGITAGEWPRLGWVIDDGALQIHQLASGETSVTLASGLANTTHTVRLTVINTSVTAGNRYTAPTMVAQITGYTKVDGSALATTADHPALSDRNILAITASLGEAVEFVADGSGVVLTTRSALNSWAIKFAQALGHNGIPAGIGMLCYSGQALAGGPGSGSMPKQYDAATPSLSTVANYSLSRPRLVNGLLSPAPYAILIEYGANDQRLSVADATVQAAVTGLGGYLQQIAPGIPQLWIVETGRWKLTPITAGFNAITGVTKYLLDAGTEMGNGASDIAGLGTGAATWRANDGLHLNPVAQAEWASRLLADYQRQTALALGSGGGSRGMGLGL